MLLFDCFEHLSKSNDNKIVRFHYCLRLLFKQNMCMCVLYQMCMCIKAIMTFAVWMYLIICYPCKHLDCHVFHGVYTWPSPFNIKCRFDLFAIAANLCLLKMFPHYESYNAFKTHRPHQHHLLKGIYYIGSFLLAFVCLFHGQFLMINMSFIS